MLFDSKYGIVYANTAALTIIKCETFRKLNGFDEDYKICFEDLDLNLRAIKDLGLKNVMCYDATAIHNESSTRGKELNELDIWKIRTKMAEFIYWSKKKEKEQIQ